MSFVFIKNIIFLQSHEIIYKDMEVIYITMSITVVLAVFFLYLFFKNVKSGQYDDTYTPSVRMLFDDELVKANSQEKNLQKDNSKSVQNK